MKRPIRDSELVPFIENSSSGSRLTVTPQEKCRKAPLLHRAVHKLGARLARHQSMSFCKRAAMFAIVAIAMGSQSPTIYAEQRNATKSRDAVSADRPPMALKQLNDDAVSLFDAVRKGDWAAADIGLASVKEATSNLPSRLPYPDVVSQLRSRVHALAGAVHARRTIASLDDANNATKLVAEIADQYQVRVPFEISMLAYYGRQLELGAASQRSSVLKNAAVDLRSTWDRIEPTVLRRGDIADARSLTDVIVQLDAARRPADFAKAAEAELAIASRLRETFETGS
jgi:hypothetical protein